MEVCVYNPQKGRLETIDAVFTQENTTWFDNWVDSGDIYFYFVTLIKQLSI